VLKWALVWEAAAALRVPHHAAFGEGCARCSEATCMALCRDKADVCESASKDSASSRRLTHCMRNSVGLFEP
jgi:hypothetical protein